MWDSQQKPSVWNTFTPPCPCHQLGILRSCLIYVTTHLQLTFAKLYDISLLFGKITQREEKGKWQNNARAEKGKVGKERREEKTKVKFFFFFFLYKKERARKITYLWPFTLNF